MKRLLAYCLILIGIVSCNLNKNKITQTDFERLFVHDSIESISLYANEETATIRLKSEKEVILPIRSSNDFKTSLNVLQKSLESRKIFISYSLSEGAGPKWFEYGLFSLYPIFLLLTFVLFLFAVIDVLKRSFDPAVDKLVWFLVVFLLPFIGPVLYFFIGKKQRK